MSDLNNWELTCRLIGIDPKATTTKPSIKMPALSVYLNQFQFFAKTACENHVNDTDSSVPSEGATAMCKGSK